MAKFTGKHLCGSLFVNKTVDRWPTTLLRASWYITANFPKFLTAPILQNSCDGLLLTFSITFRKKITCVYFFLWTCIYLLDFYLGSTIIIKSPYVITYMSRNFGVRDVLGKILKSICPASYLLPTDFANNFS